MVWCEYKDLNAIILVIIPMSIFPKITFSKILTFLINFI